MTTSTRFYLDNDGQAALLDWASYWLLGSCGDRLPEGARAIGVREKPTGTLRCVFVFVETYRGIIDVHIATDHSRRWCSRNVIRGFFGYLFLLRRAFRVQAVIEATNTKAKRLLEGVGFREEACLDSGWAPGTKAILFSMTPGECRWLDDEDKKGLGYG